MITPVDHDNNMDERNNNFLNATNHTNEPQHNSGLTKAELRKSNKPIMEKKRRARINHCLNELKTLILDAMKKDPARHTKLEKADILEMTVKHLQTIQRNQIAIAVHNDPSVIHKFKAGFSDCTDEVSRYINRMEGVDSGVKTRLINHLNNCVGAPAQITPYTHLTAGNSYRSSGNVLGNNSILPNPSPIAMPQDVNNNGRIQVGGMQLIPSRLPTGELALVMPNSSNLSYFPSSNFTPQNPVELNITVPRISAFNSVAKQRTKRLSNSPPLSPTSSITSCDESMNATEYQTVTPPLQTASNFVNIFPTPPSGGSIELTLNPTITLQQPHVTSTSELVKIKPLAVITNINSNRSADVNFLNKKRSYPFDTNEDCNGCPSKMFKSEEPEQKPFAGNEKQDLGSGDMWRPW
ncbi:Protein deadpan [Pseudolycoriella hygida]|uniref:Protein deadpan n=1 Tax=Pseudolycoriella hygida TaxID=35572 RepID=A0A9Q0MLA5_9DIPT|nr:Protein deadpan [Pseudolycoriella hygida]